MFVGFVTNIRYAFWSQDSFYWAHFVFPLTNLFSVKGFLIYAFLATFSLSQISQRTSIQVLAAVARNKGLASLPTRLHQVENISGRQLDGCLLLLLRILLARINSPWLKGLFLHIPSPFRGTNQGNQLSLSILNHVFQRVDEISLF